MFIHCELVILMLALTLDGLVSAVYGGHKAVPHSRPYMVLVEPEVEDGRKNYCGGFLLTEDFVMTAAHCQAKSYTVLLGVHNVLDRNEIQRMPVEHAFPHADYNANQFINDIMLLKLRFKANFSKNVRNIALAGRGDGCFPKSCFVSGWGRNEKYANVLSHMLMEVNVTLTDNEQCAKERLYCSEGESGPAPGDGGGPLVCEDEKAYGVVSSVYTPHSGRPLIHVFTKITEYRNWIDWITEPNIYICNIKKPQN